jgi:integrase
VALTELGIRRLKAPKAGKRRERADREIVGLVVRVTENNIRSYNFIYTHGTRTTKSGKLAPWRHRITLGRVGELTLEEAREMARELRKKVRQGGHPAVEQKLARAVTKPAAVTFGEVVDLYERRDLGGKRSGHRIRQTIDLHLIPAWKDLPLTAVTRAHVLERVEALMDASKPEMARRVFQTARRLFGWAIARGTFGLEHSPCEKLRPTDLIGERRVRERILTDKEWRALLRAVQALGYLYYPLIELLALTGLRLREVADARWAEFDFDLARWTIPSLRMKGARLHVVPLTPRMIKIVDALPRTGEFLFPNDDGSRPFSSFSLFKQKIDERMGLELRREDKKAKLEPWRLHDIRRSMRTHLSTLAIDGGDLVRELLLAHAKPGLHKVYDQYAYLDERHRAYVLWEQRLAAIREKRSASVIGIARRAGESR